jgi:hypothetical protein
MVNEPKESLAIKFMHLQLLGAYAAVLARWLNPMALHIVATTIGLAVVGGIIAGTEVGPILVGCTIQGNISKNTGERIYHVSGQEYYAQTRINWLSGERWFCCEADARAAGWRKSRS